MRILVIQRVKQATHRAPQGFGTLVTIPRKYQGPPVVPFSASPTPPAALVEKSFEHVEFAIVLFQGTESIGAFLHDAREDMACRSAPHTHVLR